MSLENIGQEFLRQYTSEVVKVRLSLLNEIILGFVARHKCDPENVVLIERTLPDGGTAWTVRRKLPSDDDLFPAGCELLEVDDE